MSKHWRHSNLETHISTLRDMSALAERTFSRSVRLKPEVIDRCQFQFSKIKAACVALEYIVRSEATGGKLLNLGVCPSCGGRVINVDGGNVCSLCGEMSGCY